MFTRSENSRPNHPGIQYWLDQSARWLAFDDLPRNQRAIRLTSLTFRPLH